MSWLRELWTQLWITLVVAVVMLALYSSLGRQLAPLVETWQPEAEQYLSGLLGQPVQMASLKGGWSILSPTLTVQGLTVGGGEGLQIEQLEAELDIGASAFWQQPVFRRIEISGVRLQLQQLQPRQWQLAPGWVVTLPEADPDAAPAPEPAGERPAWLQWLELQQTISLHDWQINSQDLQHAPDALRIDHLFWRNRGRQHEIDGQINWGRDELAGIRVQGSLQGPLWPLQHQHGELYLEIDPQDWQRWVPDELPAGLSVHALRAGARGWLRLQDGDLQALYLDLAVEQLNLHTRGEPLQLADGRLLLAGQHTGSDWHLRLQPQFSTPLPFDSLSLSSVAVNGSKGWQIGIPAADVDGLQRLLLQHQFLPDEIAPYIAGTQPEGRASDIRFSFLPASANAAARLDVRAQLDEVSSSAYRGIPAFSGLSGSLHIHPAAGALRVSGDEMLIHLADLYPQPWALENVQGVFRWFLQPGLSTLQVQGLRADLQHSPADQPGISSYPVTAELQIQLPGRDSPREAGLGLLLGLPQAPLDLREQLIPDLVDAEVRNWLDQSLQQGNARQAAFALQTVLGSEHPRNSTSTQLYLEFMQAQLSYLPDWPAAEQLQGRLLLDAPALDVWLDQGRTLGGQLLSNSGRVRLRPGRAGGSELEVSARLQGDSGEALQYFTHTPLQQVVNHAFDQWQASGPLQAGILLRQQLGAGSGEPDISIDASVRENRLHLGELDLTMTALDGALRYTSKTGLSARALSGRIFGGTFRAAIRSEVAAAGALNIYLEGEGDGQWQAFREWLPLFLLEPLSGQLNYQAGMQLTAEGLRFRLQSDLTGTRIDLPYPVGKDVDAVAPLQVVLQPGDGLRMQFRYNELVDADLLLEGSELQRGQIHLGGLPASLPAEPGVLLSGQLATELIAEDWWDAWQRISHYQQQQAVAGAYSDAAGSSNPLQRIDVTLGQVLAWGMPMGVTDVLGQQQPQRWDFNVDSQLLRGLVQIPHADGPLRAELDYLHFPHSDEEAAASTAAATTDPVDNDPLQTVNPQDFPALDLKVAEVFAGDRQMGRWDFSSRPAGQGLQVQIHDSDIHGLRLQGQLDWQYQDGRHSTVLSGLSFGSKNVGAIQRGFRQVPVVEGSELEGSGEFRWAGSPLAYNVATMAGNVALRIRDGSLVSDGAGALRAFGVLNVNSMSRRLKLDFSDLYQSGVAFDTLRGSARLEQGVLTFTEPLLVDGPSGRFQTSGSTNLMDETLNMKLAVTLPVTSSLPMVAILAGFAPPVAASIYVTEKLIGDELSRFTSTSYDIGGTWSEPDMRLKRAFDNQVDGSESRSLKQRILSIFGLEDD
ncbi:TIGR02099 family protein [Oceanospirillaceae bacterium ASx5O]|nr:TIGR02099 family protein [Oceanospirillaceae bacterium ASx5O]